MQTNRKNLYREMALEPLRKRDYSIPPPEIP